jgi:hypothetical protein
MYQDIDAARFAKSAGDAYMLPDKYVNTGILSNFFLYPYNYLT